MSVNAVESHSVNSAITWGFSRSNNKYSPATAIIGSLKPLEGKVAKEKLDFCYRAALRALESFGMERYSDFDGLTTSNCCHGMAVFACDIIRSVLQLDLKAIQREGNEKIQELASNPAKNQDCTWTLRLPVIHLTCLYVLGFIREIDPVKGCRTVKPKLQDIAPVSKALCGHIVDSLQKQYSNLIASSYGQYALEVQKISSHMQVSGAPLEMWAKYVDGTDYIRTDKRGINYVSNLFSMQVSLAYLIHSKAKAAVINDIFDLSGCLKGRYVCLFEGDGKESLRPLSREEIKLAQISHQEEPVVVFGGCVYSDSLTKEMVALHMQPWLDKFPELMLACDAIYPQFIKIGNDPHFDSHPIRPDEESLAQIINEHLQIEGVSASDPSLYCATHISPASFKQVFAIWNADNEMALPISFVPGVNLNQSGKTTSYS